MLAEAMEGLLPHATASPAAARLAYPARVTRGSTSSTANGTGHWGYDRSVARIRKLDQEVWRGLPKPLTSLAVGATAAHADLFPGGLGIGPRREPRNTYLGLVVTRPDASTFVFGLNYFDAADEGDNEDMYRLDTTTFELKPYMRGRFEKDYPEYAGHHVAAKPYLRKPPGA